MDSSIVWTTVPGGFWPDGSVRVSAIVTPRINNPRQSLPPPFDDWPLAVRNLTFKICFIQDASRTSPEVCISGAKPVNQLDSAMWKYLFPQQTGVKIISRVQDESSPIRSYPARSVSKSIRYVYRTFVGYGATSSGSKLHLGDLLDELKWEQYDDLSAQISQAGNDARERFERRVGDKVRLSFPNKKAEENHDRIVERDYYRLANGGKASIKTGGISVLLGDLHDLLGTRQAIDYLYTPAEDSSRFKAEDFLQLALFHRKVPDDHSTTRDAVRKTLGIQRDYSFDLHERLSLISNYPALLRPLGLVIDFKIDLPRVPGQRTGLIYLTPDPNPLDLKPVSPRTNYEFQSGMSFRARDRQDDWIVNGLLKLDYEDRAVLTKYENYSWSHSAARKFQLETIDLDGAALKLINQATNDERKNVVFQDTVTAEEREETPPSMRSPGIALLTANRATDIVNARKRAKELEKPDEALDAHDLVKGYIPEIWVKNPKDPKDRGQWYSLCRRKEKYIFGGRRWSPDGVQEGLVRQGMTRVLDHLDSQVATPPQDDSAGETLFTWTGWNLAVPKPREKWNVLDCVKDIENPPPEETPPWDIQKEFTIIEKLPPLRYGVEYFFRVRTVDLAGNSVYPDRKILGPDWSFIHLENKPYKRVEPVVAPDVLLADSLNPAKRPGTKLDRLVIRSHSDDDERWIVPPRISHKMAELHGLLDDQPLSEIGGFDAAVLNKDGSFPIDAGSEPQNGDSQPIGNPIFFPSQGEKVDCPYYPDPFAVLASLAVTDLVSNRIDYRYVHFYPNGERFWPHATPFRIVLQSLDANKKAIEFEEVFSTEPKIGRSLIVKLPPAWEAALDLSSGFGLLKSSTNPVTTLALAKADGSNNDAAKKLSLMELWVEFEANQKNVAETLGIQSYGSVEAAAAKEKTANGGNPLLSPHRQLRLVHAVKKPLLIPSFTVLSTSDRAYGVTKVDLEITTNIDPNSTSRVDIVADWVENIDNPNEEAPKLNAPGRARIAEKTNDVRNVDPQDLKFDGPTHEFSDTKYRRVSYLAIANSRFEEYFPKEKEAFTNTSIAVERRIPSSARPAVPNIRYIVPTFGWSKHEEESSSKPKHRFNRTRIGGGLRIFMSRKPIGWWSSGNDELLGIVLWPSLPGPDCSLPVPLPPTVPPCPLIPYVTRWGGDPIWNASLPSELPSPGVFQGSTRLGCNILLAEFDPNHGGTSAPANLNTRVNVVGYEPQFDSERNLWYCDIVVSPVPSYYCFLKLALVRYQPNSISDAEISKVVLADFAQLVPDRTVTVMRAPEEKKSLLVKVLGMPNPAGRTSIEQANRPGYSVQIVVEKRCSDLNEEMGWTVDSDVKVDQLTEEGTLWSGKLTFSDPCGSKRILVQEFEVFPLEPNSQRKAPRMRLIYADVLEL